MTARPSGADCSPPSPRASAVGIMPAIIARLVMRIGRRRPRADATMAVFWSAPACHLSLANVTSSTAFATDTPIDMIAPIIDCTLSVVCVVESARTTPASTAGIVEQHDERLANRLEVGREQEQDDHDREQQPFAQARRASCASARPGRAWPRSSPSAAGRVPRPRARRRRRLCRDRRRRRWRSR